MIWAQFRPAPAANRQYTVEMVQRNSAPKDTVVKMALATHVIETEQTSEIKKGVFAHNIKVRRLILLGLSATMALATLAPIVVLAG